jgi:antitoxin component YwqK of YwqJK toxin-antitoxin module
VWTHWNPEGRKIKQGRFKRGKKDGTWTKYTAKGHKLWGKEYLEGEQIDIKYSIKNVFK